MQEFSTDDARHDFKVNGNTYWIPGVTVGDLEDVAALATLEGKAQIEAFRTLMVTRVQPSRRTLIQFIKRAPSAPTAVRQLSIIQLGELFKAWSTMGGALNRGE